MNILMYLIFGIYILLGEGSTLFIITFLSIQNFSTKIVPQVILLQYSFLPVLASFSPDTSLSQLSTIPLFQPASYSLLS